VRSSILFFSAIASGIGGIAALIALYLSSTQPPPYSSPVPEFPTSDVDSSPITTNFEGRESPRPKPVKPVARSVDLAYPESTSKRVGEVVVSLASESYGDSRRYELCELTALVVASGGGPVFLDQAHPRKLEGRIASYLITVESLDTSACTARVHIESNPR
jgi:hypothetical protein